MATTTPPPSAAALAACSLRVKPGERLQRLIPGGTFNAPRGAYSGAGPWHLDATHAADIIARAALRTSDIPVDYEHQLLSAAENGEPAPASGWIDPRSLVFVSDGDEPGLYGAVSWTPRAAEYIASDEYRYLSPVFPYDEQTGDVLDLLHVALTNNPAIDAPLLAAATARLLGAGAAGATSTPIPSTTTTTPETSPMDELLEQLRWMLNLPLGSTAEDIAAALQKLIAQVKTAAPDATAAASFDMSQYMQTLHASVAAASATRPDPLKWVPMEAFQAERQARLSVAATSAHQQLETLIEEALGDGRLLPAQRAHAEAMGRADMAALSAFLGKAAPVAALSGMQTRNAPPPHAVAALSASEKAVCRAMGISEDDYIQSKEQ